VPEFFKSTPTAILAGNTCTGVHDDHSESTVEISHSLNKTRHLSVQSISIT